MNAALARSLSWQSVRKHRGGLQRFRSMSWIESRRRKASVLRCARLHEAALGRESAISPMDFARNFCLDVTDFSLMQPNATVPRYTDASWRVDETYVKALSTRTARPSTTLCQLHPRNEAVSEANGAELITGVGNFVAPKIARAAFEQWRYARAGRRISSKRSHPA